MLWVYLGTHNGLVIQVLLFNLDVGMLVSTYVAGISRSVMAVLRYICPCKDGCSSQTVPFHLPPWPRSRRAFHSAGIDITHTLLPLVPGTRLESKEEGGLIKAELHPFVLHAITERHLAVAFRV